MQCYKELKVDHSSAVHSVLHLWFTCYNACCRTFHNNAGVKSTCHSTFAFFDGVSEEQVSPIIHCCEWSVTVLLHFAREDLQWTGRSQTPESWLGLMGSLPCHHAWAGYGRPVGQSDRCWPGTRETSLPPHQALRRTLQWRRLGCAALQAPCQSPCI